ncbi:hypothetical protein [Parabacteroides merdae]|uniref:hypothetical protein n=1 Tax=Parabacteroides merdae TaxID=46503 RepID=UPI0034A26F97
MNEDISLNTQMDMIRKAYVDFLTENFDELGFDEDGNEAYLPHIAFFEDVDDDDKPVFCKVTVERINSFHGTCTVSYENRKKEDINLSAICLEWLQVLAESKMQMLRDSITIEKMDSLSYGAEDFSCLYASWEGDSYCLASTDLSNRIIDKDGNPIDGSAAFIDSQVMYYVDPCVFEYDDGQIVDYILTNLFEVDKRLL